MARSVEIIEADNGEFTVRQSASRKVTDITIVIGLLHRAIFVVETEMRCQYIEARGITKKARKKS